MSADPAKSERRRAPRWWAGALAGTLAVVSTITVVSTAQAVPLPPPNPSDQQIQSSEQQAQSASANVGALSGKVSSTESKIRQLRDAMELKAELAMKAQVDVQMAQMKADDAEREAQEAQADVAEAANAITDAQDQAANFAAASFKQGSVAGSITALLGSSSMSELLTRKQMIEQVSASETGVLDELQSARTAKANKQSAAREAVNKANEATKAAAEAKKKADKAQQSAEQSFSEGQDQLQALQAKLTDQKHVYQEALNKVATLKGQRVQYQTWLATKKAEEHRIEQQAALQKKHAQELMKEKDVFQHNQKQEEANRAYAIKKEKQRQAKLAKERAERAARLAKEKREREQAKKEGKKHPAPSDDTGSSSSSSSSRGEQAVQAALAYLGTPYAWGGGTARGPSRGIHDYGVADRYGDYNKIGFDCSGLALYAWAQVGVYLPHYSGYQYNYGTHVSKNNLRPGDLVFYAYDTSNPATIHHVAIYMGHGKMIQAPQSGSVVNVVPMRWNGYIGATRPGT